MIRFSCASAFASLAALATAAVARPALLWVRSLGLLRTALARQVDLGPLFLGAAALLALLSLGLALRIAHRRKPCVPLGAPRRRRGNAATPFLRVPAKAGTRLKYRDTLLETAFFFAVGICIALRQAGSDPQPLPDPRPALLAGLRTAAEELDRGYAGRYAADAAELSTLLSQGSPLPFRRLGRRAHLRARVLPGAEGPRLDALEEDPPGTVYVAISADRQTAWLTTLSLHGVLRLPAGTPAVIEARRGTHALPGTDPAVPVYPRTRAGR